MLSLENDDPSAERHLELLQDSGIPATDLIVWNAYPWYINRKPTLEEIDLGLEPLERLIHLLPNLAIVIAHGNDAQKAWHRFMRTSAGQTVTGYKLIPTYHTSRQALWTPDASERERRKNKLAADYAHTARLLERLDGDRH